MILKGQLHRATGHLLVHVRQTFGCVIPAGGNAMTKCSKCMRLIELYGTAEYILPEYCSCSMFHTDRKKNTQGTLGISGYIRVKITRPCGEVVYRQFEQ